MPCPSHAPTMPFFSRPQHSTVVERRPCCGLEKNGMVGAWDGHGMASVNQTRPHHVNEMRKTHSKPLAAQHGRETAWARHAMCESAFKHFFQTRSRQTSTCSYFSLTAPGFLLQDDRTTYGVTVSVHCSSMCDPQPATF